MLVKVRDLYSNKFIYIGEAHVNDIAEAIRNKASKIDDRYYIEVFVNGKQIGAFMFDDNKWLSEELRKILNRN